MLRPGTGGVCRGGSVTSIRAATARMFERMRPDDAGSVDAEFVTAPQTIEDAAAVIAHAADVGLSVGFHGGGTHQGLGGRLRTDVAIVTTGLSGVIDYQPEDLTVVVDGGMPIAELEAVLDERGQTAVLPEQPGAATVGGTIAAGASPFRRLRYGPTRDRVLQVTLATGYGQVVTAGGRVVKNSTGYDLARLCAGSLGSIGLIGSVCLKLWPNPVETATVAVDDAAAAHEEVYRPFAVLEADGQGYVYLGGTPQEIQAQAGAIGRPALPGLRWPDPVGSPVQVSVRVPPRDLAAAIALVRSWRSPITYRAQIGVGEMTVGMDEADVDELRHARAWAESRGGALVLLDGGGDLYASLGAWGTPPPSQSIQRRIKEAFDPAGVLNPGKLPGGL